MCDSSASIKGYLTSKDVLNSQKYAQMKIMHEMANSPQYSDKLEWVDARSDGTSTYYCPPGLVCKDGYVRIKNKVECERISNFAQYKNEDDPSPSPDKGYYLEWKTDSSGNNGQCYLGNADFRRTCETGNFDRSDKDYRKYIIKNGNLRYDTNTGKCTITKQYCESTGQFGYLAPPATADNPNGYGGSCTLSTGQKWLDYFFGTTVSRGLYGEKCFKN